MTNSLEKIDLQRIVEGDKGYFDSLPSSAQEILKAASRTSKPIAVGLSSILDIPIMSCNVGTWLGNKASGGDTPYLPYPSELVGKAVDLGTGGLSKGSENTITGKALEFGSGMLGGGLAAKSLKATPRFASWLGSTKARDAAAASTMGGVTQGAEDLGADPLTAAGIGLSTGLFGSAFLNKRRAKNFNLKAYDYAKKEGLNVPQVVFDNWAPTKGAYSLMGRYFPNNAAYKRVERNNNQSFKRKYKEYLDNTGSIERTQAQEKKVHDLAWELMDIPDSATIEANFTKSRFLDAKAILKESAIIPQKEVRDYLNREYKRLYPTPNGQAKVRELIHQENKLNDAIEKGARQLEGIFKTLRDGIREDLKRIGKPDSQKTEEIIAKYLEKSDLFKNMNKRDKQYNMLGIKKTKFDYKEVADNYKDVRNHGFSDTVAPEEMLNINASIFNKADKGTVRERNLKVFDDLVKFSKTVDKGTTPYGGWFYKLLEIAGAGASAFTSIPKVGEVVGKHSFEYFLKTLFTDDRKTLERLANYARQPTKENAKKVKNTIKKETGKSVGELVSLHELDTSKVAKTHIAGSHAFKEKEEY